ncbi:MAG: hypothetical protein V7K67_07295 [Nostoc sp.]
MSATYKADFNLWIEQTAQLLRSLSIRNVIFSLLIVSKKLCCNMWQCNIIIVE